MDNRLIAFIDILGFKKIVEQKQKTQILDYIEPFYYAKERIERDKENDPTYGLKTNSLEATFFSDSIVFSCDENDIDIFISTIKRLLDSYVMYELFLRGGISFGKLYHQNDIVFGPAMNEAYKLESKFAIYPRIIISNKCNKLINEKHPKLVDNRSKFGNVYELFDNYSPSEELYQGDDGFHFLNPFPRNKAVSKIHRKFQIHTPKDFVLRYKKNIENKLKEYKNELKIFHKYFWLAKKFNDYYVAENNIGQISLDRYYSI